MKRLAILLFAMVGCAGGDDDLARPCGVGPGRVELGEGGSRLRYLPATGGELGIVLGSQGGIHVLVGFAVRDMELEMEVVYRLVDPADGSIVGTPTTRSLRPTLFSPEDGATVRNPDLIVLDNESPDVPRFADRTVRAELEARSASSTACDARLVTLRAP